MKKTASLPNSLCRNDRQGQLLASGVFLSLRRMAFWLFLVLLLLTAVWPSSGATAQPAATLAVEMPDLATFPIVEFKFKVEDANNQPLGGFDADQVQVIENGETVSVSDLIEEYRGVHFALAINGNREMDLRDGSGVSRYEKLSAALMQWARGRTLRGEDAWSIFTNQGALVEQATTAEIWLDELEEYQPNFRLLEPELAGLQMAIQAMMNEAVDFGVDQAILYITPPLLPEQITTLNGLTQQARNQGVRVDVWMVGDGYYLNNDQGGALVALAANTGGEFIQFTGPEGIPNLADLHAALGRVESVTYTSKLHETGTFNLGVSVDLGGIIAEGESQPFHFEVLPPNPMLLSPPVLIERSWEGTEEARKLMPDSQEIAILVQFPDGHSRPLESSRLRVDGVVMDINATEPYDTFAWDLSDYEEDGQHFIQVEIEDQLGLVAETIAIPVDVQIIRPVIEPGFNWPKAGGIAAGGVAGVSLLLLVYWLVRRAIKMNKEGHPVEVVEVEDDLRARPLIAADRTPLAYLVPGQSLLGLEDPGSIAITWGDFVLPDDLPEESSYLTGEAWPAKQVWFNQQNGRFWLHSAHGPSNVWLNDQPVEMDPLEIRPGDLIYFGEMGFRFTIKMDEPSRKASVDKYEPF